MAFELPTDDMVRRLGADLGMDISAEYAQEFLDFAKALAKFDLLLMPTLPFPTLPIPPDGASLAETLSHSWTMLANTSPFDLTGHPAISVPCGETDDKPVGLMLVGKHFDEMTVLRAADAYGRRG